MEWLYVNHEKFDLLYAFVISLAVSVILLNIFYIILEVVYKRTNRTITINQCDTISFLIIILVLLFTFNYFNLLRI
jgi:hypothetical protein